MHRKSILKGKFFIKHKQRIQNTGDRRQHEKPKHRINHESTKIGKHEKNNCVYTTPFFSRVSCLPVFVLRGCFPLYLFRFPKNKTIHLESTLRLRSLREPQGLRQDRRNLENTPVKYCLRNFTGQAKKDPVFYISPSYFVLSSFRVFVIRGFLCILFTLARRSADLGRRAKAAVFCLLPFYPEISFKSLRASSAPLKFGSSCKAFSK